MAALKATERDLKGQIQELKDRHRHLKDHEVFVLWFLNAFVTDGEELALEAVCGGAGDKAVDAIAIDDDAKTVVVVQGKYRLPVDTKAESRSDVLGFAALAAVVTGPLAQFKAFCTDIAPAVGHKLTVARKRILERKYGLHLYYVTTGRCSAGLREEAGNIAARADADSSFRLFDGRHVLLLLADYLDGVAPPVPSLDLAVQSGEVLRRFDHETDIESWLFTMSSQSVTQVFERAGIRLFARNIRGFLGSTEINKAMEATLADEPEYFWYYNNGITVVCDHAEQVRNRGLDIIRAQNPQVINGQQTTRTLSRSPKGRKASVLVRVICVPRAAGGRPGQFERLVSAIVGATNSQNPVRPSDLMSNDRRQIDIERQFRKLNYGYMRKRQTKGEARRSVGAFRRLIKKEELAQAVAACELDPLIVREGKEGLFEGTTYDRIFGSTDPFFYLSRYWLMREVGYAAKGYPERGYAKWLVLHFVWNRFSSLVGTGAAKQAFRELWEKQDTSAMRPLYAANDNAYSAAIQFYKSRRGRGAKARDVSSFFKRKGLHLEFERFWKGSANRYRSRFSKAWKRLGDAIDVKVKEE